ncbi:MULTISPECIES: hypothetical protein [unclassified Microbacterium]|uniref:hypothetical protein n=1 Tax=unclassified Microbacterium TaxID=2609290 RepID=UPI003018D37E
MPLIACPVDLILAREKRALGERVAGDPTLHRVRPGVYADKIAWARLAPWDRYLARVHAVALTWDNPVFMLESAAVLRGQPVFREPADIHLLSRTAHSYRRGDVVVHASADTRELVTAQGLIATGLIDTTVDLVRVLPPAHGLAVADAALRSLGLSCDELELDARARLQRYERGLRRVAWVAERATGAAESTGESVSRAVIEWLGYEPPELQVTFHYEDVTDRVDFFWRRQRIVGESDGYGKYDGADTEASKARFIREKKREDRLRRHLGGFGRWDVADGYAFTRLDGILGTAGLTPVRARQNAFLRTLAHDPRSAVPRHRSAGTRPTGGR